jgi:hypothetical protein
MGFSTPDTSATRFGFRETGETMDLFSLPLLQNEISSGNPVMEGSAVPNLA